MALRARSTESGEGRFEVGIALDKASIAGARDLRERVYGTGMAARPGDERFEGRWDHLVARDSTTDRVVGAYRLLTPGNARSAGAPYTDRDFDSSLLIVLRERLVEVDPPCVDPAFPFETVMTHLWSGLARYLIEQRLDHVLGAASVPTRDGGHVAASIHHLAVERFASPEDYRVFPRRRLPLENLLVAHPVTLPPLLKGYLDQGAWVCGEPAVIPEAGTADFPVLMPLARMQGRDARHFLARAT